jgi:hypothetical protein
MPDHIAFKDWAPKDEDFLGPNYVAVHQGRADIWEALG